MRFLVFIPSLLFHLVGTAVASPVLSERQTNTDVENARQAIIRNNGQSFCTNFLPPVTTTRVVVSTRSVARATVARSTRVVQIVRTSTTTTTLSTTLIRTVATTRTTTVPAALQRRQTQRPPYLSMYSDATVTAACLLVVSPRTVTTTRRTTTTVAARTTTRGTSTTSITTSSTTTIPVVRATTTTTTTTIVSTTTRGTTPSPPPENPPSDSDNIDDFQGSEREPGVAGTTVTTGSPLCRDFTGAGAIQLRVLTHRFSRSLGTNSYVNDWDIADPVACCNRCASAGMGCTFWRFTDNCLIVINPTRANTCPAAAVVSVTTGGKADIESMEGPGPCPWEIRVQRA